MVRTSVRHMSKDLSFGNDARAKMLAGVNRLADAVQVRSRRCAALRLGAPVGLWPRQRVVTQQRIVTRRSHPFRLVRR